jgi:hypothetical protein
MCRRSFPTLDLMPAYCPNCSAPLQGLEVSACQNCGAQFTHAEGWRATEIPAGRYTPRAKRTQGSPDRVPRATGAQAGGGIVLVLAAALLLSLASAGNIFLIPVMAMVGMIGIGAALFAFSPRRGRRNSGSAPTVNRAGAHPNNGGDMDAGWRSSPRAEAGHKQGQEDV